MSPTNEYPKTVVLLDGAHLELRPLTTADAGLAARLDAAGDALLVVAAWDGTRAAGAVALAPRADDPTSADLRIVLEADYRGRRLGTWLLLDAVHGATALGLGRLVVVVPPGADDLAQALRRLDFVAAEGSMAGGAMVRTLYRGWTDY